MNCYVHSVPGRLRVRIPAAKGNATTREKLVNQINALEGITSVVANPVTGSLLIGYDTAITNATACLAILNIQTIRQPATSIRAHDLGASSRTGRVASKMAEAALWYVLEKTVERCLPPILAALF
jgi:hypothetical protein